MPHHSTYRRILAEVVAPDELDALVGQYLTQRKQLGRQVVVSIDGKILRGTLGDDGAGVHLVAAYLAAEGIVLLEMAVGRQENEIPVAARVLQCVDLRDKVIIGDAMHTQRALSVQIVTAGGDYIWFAKGNQPEIERDIRLWFEPDVPLIPGMGCPPKDFESATTVNKGHGRLERRTLTVSSQLQDFLEWPFLAQVFKLQRRFTNLKTGEVQEQVSYGFTSLTREAVSPQQLLAMIRSYWRIENGLHYRRDVTLQEDDTRLTRGHAGQVMAGLNNLVLGILDQRADFPYIPAARRYFAAFPKHALALITRL
jgi:predicted transposase YbfD/YdcC